MTTMRELQDNAIASHPGATRTPQRPFESALDGLVHGANVLLLAAVLWSRQVLPHAAMFAVCHVTLALFLCWLSARVRPEAALFDPLMFLHRWLPAIIIVLMYFELGVLIPLLRDFNDLRFDHALQALDVWLLGDPVALVEHYGSPVLSDILTACYFAYYPLALVMPATLYVRGAKLEFEQAAAVILVGFMLSYIGYVLFPALGPHRVFDAYRPQVLAGFGFSGVAYEWLCAVPHEPPDAFPSGHALIAVLVSALAWRWTRALFYFVLPIAIGIVLATVYLRLHYLADVVAAFAIAPVCYAIGSRITRPTFMSAAQTAAPR